MAKKSVFRGCHGNGWSDRAETLKRTKLANVRSYHQVSSRSVDPSFVQGCQKHTNTHTHTHKQTEIVKIRLTLVRALFAFASRLERSGRSELGKRGPVTQQTSQVTGRISAMLPLRLFALPEGNLEELSKNFENIHETKFPVLLSGTNIIELR